MHCVGNKSETFQFNNNSVEIFSEYIQEVNLKNFIILISFYLHSCFGPHVCIGNFRLKFLELCLGVVVSETSSYYTHIILSPNFTNSFSRHNTISSHTTLWLHFRHRMRQTSLFECYLCLPTCIIVSRISFTRMNLESRYEISTSPLSKE